MAMFQYTIFILILVIQLESQNVAQTFCTDIRPGLQCSQSFNSNEIKCYLNGFLLRAVDVICAACYYLGHEQCLGLF